MCENDELCVAKKKKKKGEETKKGSFIGTAQSRFFFKTFVLSCSFFVGST